MKFYNGIDFLLLASHSGHFPMLLQSQCFVQLLYCQGCWLQKIINNFGFIITTMIINQYLKI